MVAGDGRKFNETFISENGRPEPVGAALAQRSGVPHRREPAWRTRLDRVRRQRRVPIGGSAATGGHRLPAAGMSTDRRQPPALPPHRRHFRRMRALRRRSRGGRDEACGVPQLPHVRRADQQRPPRRRPFHELQTRRRQLPHGRQRTPPLRLVDPHGSRLLLVQPRRCPHHRLRPDGCRFLPGQHFHHPRVRRHRPARTSSARYSSTFAAHRGFAA